MFDKYLIVDGSLRNVGPSDAPSGFAFEAKLGYYRGLGLSMVDGFVRQAGGRLGILSTPGKGTCVNLYLPAHYSSD